ncbi:YARHG domain-containing protein [Crocinitomicaceae bacterium]|nr:YARHG domain-containing protein [Crocinitomicaceae bacterium]
MKNILFYSFLCCSVFVNANDGAFYMNGNQLIPVNETQVELRKEILTVKRVGRNILIDVDYTFYNPGKSKEVLMGFEAPMPRGAAEFQYDRWKMTRNHPHLNGFIVEINGIRIPYKADIVNKRAFNTIGSLAGFPQSQIDLLNESKSTSRDMFHGYQMGKSTKGKDQFNYRDFLFEYVFVNYFDAKFNPGINKVHHTYSFPISGTNDVPLDFRYILTAANRWANNQIDDFTLIVDMGDFRDYYINQTFFKGTENWNDAALLYLCNPFADDMEEMGMHIGRGHENGSLHVRTKEAPLIYQQKDFRPKGELNIWGSHNAYSSEQGFYEYYNVLSDTGVFDIKEHSLWYAFHHHKDDLRFAKDEFTLQVLRNFPFAIRGYVFKNRKLRNYYLRYGWYEPDPSLKLIAADLPEKELKWIYNLSVYGETKRIDND